MRSMRWPRAAIFVVASSASCTFLTPLSGLSDGEDREPAPPPGADAVAPGDARMVDATTDDAGDAPDPYIRAVLEDAPIAYYRFEETTGTVAQNEIAGSKATVVYPSDGVTLGAPGMRASSRGVRLDDPEVQLAVNGAMTFTGSEPFTVEVWIRFEADPISIPVFRNMDQPYNTAQRNGFWVLVNSDGQLRGETWLPGTHTMYTLASSPVLRSGEPYHVVFSYSDVEDKDRLFVNAAPAQGNRLKAGLRSPPASPLLFQGFRGTIDELAIYAKALTPDRVAAHYAAR